MTILASITAALNAWVAWVQWRQETELDRIEDEIDALAADGSPASKLRMERLGQRLKRKRKRALRSSDRNDSTG